MFVETVKDARAIRARLFDILDRALLPGDSDQRQRELLHIAIVGGEPTGVELCAEIYDLAHRDLSALYGDVTKRLKITVYDVAPHILSAYDKQLFDYANRSLSRRDVEIATSTYITNVDKMPCLRKKRAGSPTVC